MNNQEQFVEFLSCCREEKVHRILLADVWFIVNQTAGDFGSVVIEFEHCNYIVTAMDLSHKPEDEEIEEFYVRKFQNLDDIKDEITEDDIFTTLSHQNNTLAFVTEMVDEDGYFDGMEWKVDDFFMFMFASYPAIIVSASYGEETKLNTHPHQSKEGVVSCRDEYVNLFRRGNDLEHKL